MQTKTYKQQKKKKSNLKNCKLMKVVVHFKWWEKYLLNMQVININAKKLSSMYGRKRRRIVYVVYVCTTYTKQKQS